MRVRSGLRLIACACKKARVGVYCSCQEREGRRAWCEGVRGSARESEWWWWA